MSRSEKFDCASISAPCLPARSKAPGEPGKHGLRILCDDARLTAMCNELARALSNAPIAHRGEKTGNAYLTLRYVTARFTDNLLSGHLVWHDGLGRTGSSPPIELTLLDAKIDDGVLRDYARQLLTFTRLPL